MPLMRPEVNAGPIDRKRSPLKVGGDIGSPGRAGSSGFSSSGFFASGDFEGSGDGCCRAGGS